MINLLLRLLGFGKAVDALDGETSKAYIGGLGMILTGGASLLDGSSHVAAALLAAHGGADYFAIGKALYQGDADTATIIAGFALISKGIAEIGQRHAAAKLSNTIASAAPIIVNAAPVALPDA